MSDPAADSAADHEESAGTGGGRFLALATVASSLLRAVFLVLVGRLLGPSSYAELYAALSLIFLLGTGLTPMGSAIAHYTSHYAGRGELGKVATLAREMPGRVARWSAALLVLGVLAAYPSQRLLGFGSLAVPLWIAVALALTLQVSSPRGLMRGLHLFRAYGVNVLVEALLRLGIAVPLLLWSATAASGVAAYALAGLGALLLGRFQAKPVAGSALPEPADPRPLERMVGPLLVFALATAAFQNLDMLFVKRFFPAADAGLYAAASSVAKLTALAFLPFGVSNLPLFTAALARGESLGKKLLRAMAAYLLLAGGGVAVLAAWGGPILRLLYGEVYADAARWLVPLAGALTLSFLAAMIGQALCAARRYGFLWLLAAALLGEIAALLRWSHSLDAVPAVLLAVQAVTLGTLALFYPVTRARGRKP